VVDDEGIDGEFEGLELEPELVLVRGEDGYEVGATLFLGLVGAPLEDGEGENEASSAGGRTNLAGNEIELAENPTCFASSG
jgi:hypothetical protein